MNSAKRKVRGTARDSVLQRRGQNGIAVALILPNEAALHTHAFCACGEIQRRVAAKGKAVRQEPNADSRAAERWRCRLAGGVLLTLGLSGCASLWDEVTSKDFSPATL